MRPRTGGTTTGSPEHVKPAKKRTLPLAGFQAGRARIREGLDGPELIETENGSKQ
jgi:hypothetical protein